MINTKSIIDSDINYDDLSSSHHNPKMFILKEDLAYNIIEDITNVDTSPALTDDGHSGFEQEFKNTIAACPDFVKEIVLKFTSKQEQVMCLYSTIALTGSLMPYLKINYDSKTNYPALMLLAIFPPASGKGCLSLIRKLGQKIDNELYQEYSNQMRQYKTDLAVYNKAIKSGALCLPPVEPKQVLFMAPGDTTTARLVKQISENGPGQFLTMFETEADVLSDSASNSQYGKGLSTIIRKAFHSEPISQMRKTGGEHYVADTPKLSIILSGTANQVIKLFKSNEDGMYSRFLIIVGDAPIKWKNVKPDPTKQPLDEYFTLQAEEFYNMWQFFKNRHIEVKFSDCQWNQINAFGEMHLAIMHNFVDELSGSIAKRHANMLTRMAAILTMIRCYQTSQIPAEIICSDIDFNIALWMIEQSLKWSLELYKMLPGKKTTGVIQEKSEIFAALPNEFRSKDAEIQFKHIKKRTLQRRLKDFMDSNLLISVGHGLYQKTDVAQLALSQFNDEQQDD
jgi:hypothetical protein